MTKKICGAEDTFLSSFRHEWVIHANHIMTTAISSQPMEEGMIQ
jgi:hypothetical protein